MSIKSNVSELFEELQSLSLHEPIKVCAATKYGDAAALRELYTAGITIMGENRVEAFLEKESELQDLPIHWHFIGSLQSRKVKKMINRIECLHSLDRLSLAEEIEKHRLEPLDCFIEVNASGEETKQGLSPREVIPFIETLKDYSKIRVIGLMTMAPLTMDTKVIRKTFRTLKELQLDIIALDREDCPCRELSMGMSQDYRIAIEEGATIIRVGSKLFK